MRSVVIDHADALAEKDFFPHLVSVLCQAADHANLSLDTDGDPRDRPPFPLHFVLLFADGELGRLVDDRRTREGPKI